MRHVKQRHSSRMPRILIAALLIVSICVGSVVTVMANSAEITVYDEGNAYTFNMIGADPESILARAETEGMPPITQIDNYEYSESAGTLTVNRSVQIVVDADGVTEVLVAPKASVLSDVLEEAGITLNKRDEIEPAADTVLTSDAYVTIVRSNRVFIDADGTRRMVDVLGGTVNDALKAAEITLDERDVVTPSLDTELKNGTQISVARYITVTFTADGNTITKDVAAKNYAQAVEAADIDLGEEDRIYVQTANGEMLTDRKEAIEDGAVIRVARVRTEEVTVNEAIEYATIYENTDTLYEDETEVKKYGTTGEKSVTYLVTYEDGVEIARKVANESVLQQAEDEVILCGTKEREAASTGGNGTFTDGAGETVSYEYCITGDCTAYSWDAGSVTAVGEPVQVGYVAVDPNIIPYGSLLYITSPYGTWDYGYCYAMDTGGAAMAGTIVADLFYDTEAECDAFGRRPMNVYVIRSGW